MIEVCHWEIAFTSKQGNVLIQIIKNYCYFFNNTEMKITERDREAKFTPEDYIW